ncbi:hypothetical protein [Devosia aquimaris]|uniref:hypothetical protein n=1 Tax=Devosia aquimaris TaxID=2866214 RepID=UPI001CD09FF4|nr:hypothetical protein [Devosia sp. CJK-A8-3]
MATIAQTVAFLARELNLPEPYVAQRARRLREAGLLPASNGRDHPAIRVEHLASLVLALAADVAVKDAPGAVTTYSGLMLHGVDPAVMPEHLRPSGYTVRHYLEHILKSLTADDADCNANRRLTIELVSSWPEVRIFDPADGHSMIFVKSTALPNHWQGDAVRRSTTIHGRALFRVAHALL